MALYEKTLDVVATQTSPYFIGYKIPQVNGIEALEEIADEIRNRLDKKY